MSFTLTRALRVLASSLGLSPSGRRTVGAAPKTIPPSSRIRVSAPRPTSVRNVRATSVNLIASAVAAALEPLEGRAMMSTTYYVSPSGNDANSGTSTSSPWKSIAKVNAESLSAGDQVLFQGGQSFSGTVKRTSGNGTAASPIVIGSYGSGKATISAGSNNGIYLYNVGGYSIQNLNVVGTTGGTQQDGMRLEADSSLAPITVNDCSVSGFYAAGILLLSDKSGAQFAKATITNDSVHDNTVTGIFTCAASGKMSNVYIGYDTAYDNPGKSGVTCTGNGIMCGNLEGATIEHDVAYGNGAKGTGGVGIWAYSSDKVTIQYCSSYGNLTTNVDGDGFDFDADTSNSVMQYNYSADNDGGGFMNDQWKNDSTQTNNVIRFNVAQNNCRLGNYGELEVWGKVINAEFYGNTVYNTATSGGSAAIRVNNYTITSLHGAGIHFANNVLVTTGGADLINVPASMLSGTTGLTFTGNDYYSSGSSTKMVLGTSTYSSLSAFQAAGYEKLNGAAVGSTANPLLVGGGSAGTSVNTGTNLASYLSAYQLQKTSTVKGVSLSSALGVTLTGTDFYGDTVSASTTTPGADTVASTTAASSASSVSPTPTPTPTTTTTSSSLTQRTGTLIGTAGSYLGKGNTIAKTDDGNLNTFFDGPDGGTDWVGVKLSAAQSVSTIKFAPRAGYTSRMVGGIFEASNSPDFTNAAVLYTVTKAPTAGTPHHRHPDQGRHLPVLPLHRPGQGLLQRRRGRLLRLNESGVGSFLV